LLVSGPGLQASVFLLHDHHLRAGMHAGHSIMVNKTQEIVVYLKGLTIKKIEIVLKNQFSIIAHVNTFPEIAVIHTKKV